MSRRLLTCILTLVWLFMIAGKSYAWNQTPIADVNDSVTPYEQWVCVGQSVELDGSWSYDWDGYIIDWYWDIYYWNGIGWDWDDYEWDEKTSHTFYDPGEYWIELWVQDDDYAWCDPYDTDWCFVYVVEVASLLPDQGTEFDDGDGNPDTKSFAVCVAASGVVTVTATPNPSVAETDLPACWTLTGGTGSGKLTRTVDKTTWGHTEITCSAGSSAKTTTIYVVKTQVMEPDEIPVTDNNFAFNSASPGVCNVYATGVVLGGLILSPDLEWTLTPISGSTLTSSPAPPKGANITFTYTTLPSSNSDFGEKTLTLTHPDLPAACKEDTQTVEIFFIEEATNHPGGSTPNWYYYWKQTAANFGTHSWEAGAGSGQTRFEGGQWKAFLRNANESAAAGTWNNAEGIDFFAHMCRHEERHRLDFITLWGAGSDRDPGNDGDNDYLPDDQEANLVAGHPYDNTKYGTYPDTFNYGENPLRDCEDYSLRRQSSWTNGSADSVDWANPGHQSTQ